MNSATQLQAARLASAATPKTVDKLATPPLHVVQDNVELPVAPDPDPELPPARPNVMARNVFVTLAAQLLSWGVTFVVTLFVPRYIGARGFGMLNVATAFASVASIGATLGTGSVLIREIARDNNIVAREVAAGLVLRTIFGVAIALVAVAVAAAMGYSRLLVLVIGLSLISMLLSQIGDVLNCALQGLERMPQQNAAFLTTRVIVAALQIAAVMNHLSLLIVVGATIVGAVVNLVYATVCLKPFLRDLALPPKSSVVQLFQAGLPFLSIAVFSGIYAQSDSILLSKLGSLDEVGWYGLARNLIGSTLVIPVAVCSAMLPTLSRLYLENRDQFVAVVARVMNMMLICVTPFIALLLFAPMQILAFLHYPAGFARSIPVLMAMAGAALMWYVSQVAATALIASDRQKQLSRATSIGAAICIPTSIVLILLFRTILHNGAIGAAVSNGLVECVIFAGYARVLPAGIIGWSSVGVIARSVVAGLPLVAWLTYAPNHFWFAVGLIPGMMIYAALCWAMKCFHASDLDMLRQIVRRKVAA